MASDLLQVFQKMLRPLSNRLANMVARAVVSGVDDTLKMQLLQIAVGDDETRDGVERYQNYGFTSVPLEGAEGVVLFAGGRRDAGYILAVDDRRYRLKELESGEVAVYNSAGAKVVLKADGSIEFNGGTTPVAKEGSGTTGHTHSLSSATAGPYPVVGSTLSATDSIASGAGSADVKVP